MSNPERRTMTRRQMLMLLAAAPLAGYLARGGVAAARGQAFHARAKFEAAFIPSVSIAGQRRRRPGKGELAHG